MAQAAASFSSAAGATIKNSYACTSNNICRKIEKFVVRPMEAAAAVTTAFDAITAPVVGAAEEQTVVITDAEQLASTETY